MVQTIEWIGYIDLVTESQSPQVGAMVQTGQPVKPKRSLPSLNPLKSGQWFRLWVWEHCVESPIGLNPLKSGQWFRLYWCDLDPDVKKVSIPSSRGNGSDTMSPGAFVPLAEGLNPLKSGQWFRHMPRWSGATLPLSVSIPSSRGNGSDKGFVKITF
jgi:hypothetical protein